MASNVWPKFFAEVIEMIPDPDPPKRHIDVWQLPTHPHETSVQNAATNREGIHKARLYCDGNNLIVLPKINLDRCEPFATRSIYNDNGVLKGVNYDATSRIVGKTAAVDDTPSSSKNVEPAQGGDSFMVWSTLSFLLDKDTGSSYVDVAGGYERPVAHRADATWPRFIFPISSRSAHERTTAADSGGMNASLAVLIALFAFSVPPGQIGQYLNKCFRDGQYERPREEPVWAGRYGLIVKVYASPNESTCAQLENFEKGVGRQPLFR